MKYEWRDARPEDVGKKFPMRVGDTRESMLRSSPATDATWTVGGGPGKWSRFSGWLAIWPHAQVYAPVEDDQTQAFDFEDSQRLEYEKAAMVALLSNPAICHGDPAGNRSTYLGQAETKPWLVSQAMQIARLMMEARK